MSQLDLLKEAPFQLPQKSAILSISSIYGTIPDSVASVHSTESISAGRHVIPTRVMRFACQLGNQKKRVSTGHHSKSESNYARL